MDYLPAFAWKLIAHAMKWIFQMCRVLPQASPDEVLSIESRDKGRLIKAHLYRPSAGTASACSPVLLSFHGSGFVFPLHGSDDKFCRFISEKTGYTVLDVQYRLAPEKPFPAAVHDMEDSVKWVQSQPERFDKQRLSICGFSAGANLALVGASTSFPQSTFRSVIAFYPPTDLSIDAYAKDAPDPSGTPIAPWMARCFDRVYIPAGVNPEDPRISPAHVVANNFPGKVVIFTAAQDSLAPEAERLAAKIKAVPGKEVVCRRWEGCGHGYNMQPKDGSAAANATEESYALVVDVLKSHLG